MGETVYVDRQVAAFAVTHRHLITPRVEFAIGSLPAIVEVRVRPWLTVRGFSLSIGGHLVYAEGCLRPL
jgi:hypothetical protein